MIHQVQQYEKPLDRKELKHYRSVAEYYADKFGIPRKGNEIEGDNRRI